MKIAIVGAGNAGQAHACKLCEAGHQVRLAKTSHVIHTASFERILATGRIEYIDNTQGGKHLVAKPELITYDVACALQGAEVVMIMTQSLQHEDLAARLAPYFEDGQLVIVVPGNMGSHFLRKRCRAMNVLFAEGESTPYDARIVEPGVVQILFKNVRNALAFLPASRHQEGIAKAGLVFETYRYLRKNIVESAMHNPNLIVHTVGCLMSAARIEMAQGEFWMYREAFSPSVWRLIEQLDKEKNDVLEAFGCERLRYLDACKFRNEVDLSVDGFDVFQRYARTGGPKGPASLKTRYVYEDVPNGLCLLASLGRKAGVPTPCADSLINIACFLMGENFWAKGRTLERLGLAHLSHAEIVQYVNA